jgi:PAS domain-containing protein
MEKLDKLRIEALARLSYKLAREKRNVVKMGRDLVAFLDHQTLGFWIWDLANDIEFYSPKFIKSLGFKGEEDFPYVPESWRKQIFKEDEKLALENFNKHLESPEFAYQQIVRYRKKKGGVVKLFCAGAIVNRDDNEMIMIGIHELRV